jgi:hypothetical protein
MPAGEENVNLTVTGASPIFLSPGFGQLTNSLLSNFYLCKLGQFFTGQV